MFSKLEKDALRSGSRISIVSLMIWLCSSDKSKWNRENPLSSLLNWETAMFRSWHRCYLWPIQTLTPLMAAIWRFSSTTPCLDRVRSSPPLWTPIDTITCAMIAILATFSRRIALAWACTRTLSAILSHQAGALKIRTGSIEITSRAKLAARLIAQSSDLLCWYSIPE